MFVCTFLLLVIALLFYAEPVTTRVAVYLLCMAGVATIVEGITPLGLDNLSVPFVAALMYWFFLVG
jgi:dolichol kinase